MEWQITEVKPIQDYQLVLTFKNGQTKVFDVKPYLKIGVFQELKDLALFNTVKVSFDTIEWANETDFDPKFLFEESKVLNKNDLDYE